MPARMTDQKPKDSKKALSFFLKSLKNFRFVIVLALIFALITNILTLFSPKVLGNMTNSAVSSISETGSVDFDPIKTAVVQLVVLYLVVGFFNYLQTYLLERATTFYVKNLRSEIIAKISRLPISYFDKHQFGDTLSILSNDVDTLWNTLTEGLTQIISSVVTIFGCLLMMLVISPLLALVAVVVVPISVFFIAKITKPAQKHFVSQRRTLGTLNSKIEEDYSGQLIIKSNSHESASLDSFRETNEKLYEDSWRANFEGSMAFPVVHFFTNLGYVAICVLGSSLALSGGLRIGDIQAFIQYLSRFNQPLSNLSQIVVTIQETLAAAERVFGFLEEPEEAPDELDSKTIEKIRGAVEFHDVCFSYDKKKPIIKNFTASIKPGEQVAIVGPTGAGKTTIINLLMRFYDPDSGYITIDGVPTKEMKRSDVRALFGMVLQDTWLFSGKVRDNLAYGNPSATLKDIKAATSAAGIDHLIESMKGGYNAEISEDSDNISAGEKQLLTISRAMIENPPMMILDEATSNVDTRAEALIQEAFNKLTEGRTSFVIAHRLSTIRNANLILVMRDGNIVEQGTHDELLKQNGFYAELYNSQFADND
ncbi:ABC transporter ATP-binding protein [Candidatus Saccharibacteria bacterium]|nr:ABC transporter ATP-binding protein [Candidatus Saccharibacteria bacterium]